MSIRPLQSQDLIDGHKKTFLDSLEEAGRMYQRMSRIPSSSDKKEILAQFTSLFNRTTDSYLFLKTHTPLFLRDMKEYRFFRSAVFSELRNHRVITDPGDIRRKLEKQINIAELHKTRQDPFQNKHDLNSPLFNYLQFDPKDKVACGFQAHTTDVLSMLENAHCNVEVAQLLGEKNVQEDAFIASSFKVSVPGGKTHTVLLTGIFDGHGGFGAASFMRRELQQKLQKTFASFFNKTLPNSSPLKSLENEQVLSDRVLWNVLKMVCVEMHEDYITFKPPSGTTAAFSLLIDGEYLWHSNVGDSRSLITSDEKTIQLSEDMGLRFKVPLDLTEEEFKEVQKDYHSSNGIEDFDARIKLIEQEIEAVKSYINSLHYFLTSKDQQVKREKTESYHDTGVGVRAIQISEIEIEDPSQREVEITTDLLKNKEEELELLKKKQADQPSNSYEKSIWKRGGYICNDRRINGDIAPARVIGDAHLGKAVCPRPKITKISLSKEFPSSDFCFLLHASDGLWDASTTDEVAFATNTDPTGNPAQIARNLVYSSVKAFFFDNVSAVLTKIDLRALREVRAQKSDQPFECQK